MSEVADVEISAALTEDYFRSSQVKAKPPARAFAVAEDRSQAKPIHHLIYSENNGRIVHVRQDQNSHSGWTSITIPYIVIDIDPPMLEIRAFFSGKLLIVIVSAQPVKPDGLPNNRLYTWSEIGGWQQGLAAIQVELQANYGLSNDVNFFRDRDDPQNKLYLYSVFFNDSFPAGVEPQIEITVWKCPENANESFKCVDWMYQKVDWVFNRDIDRWLLRSLGENSVCIVHTTPIEITWDQRVFSSMPQLICPSSVHVSYFPAVNRFKSASILGMSLGYLIEMGDLLLIEGGVAAYNGSFQIVDKANVWGGTAPGFERVVSGFNPSNSANTIFASDDKSQLWVSGNSSNGLTATSWTCLGNVVTSFACPPVMVDGPEVFIFDVEGRLLRLHQTGGDSVWATEKIETPDADTAPPREVAALNVRAKLVDKNGSPVVLQPVKIETDQLFTARIDGESHRVTRSSPLTMLTDHTGSVSVVLEPTSFAAMPKLTLSSGDVSRWVHLDEVEQKSGDEAFSDPTSIANRLSGNDPRFEVSAATLEAAGLLQQAYRSSSAAAEAVKAVGRLLNERLDGRKRDAAAVASGNWTLSFAGGAPVFTTLTPDQAEGHVRRAFGTADDRRRWSLGSLIEKVSETISGVTSDVKASVGDALHRITQAADKVKDVTVAAVADVADATLLAVTTIEGGVERTTNLIMSTPKHAGALADILLDRLAEGGKAVAAAATAVKDEAIDLANKALDWVKDKLGWKDILVAHRVYKEIINALFEAADAAAGTLEAKLDGLLDDLKSIVSTNFDQVQRWFAGKTVGGMSLSSKPGDTFANLKDVRSGGSAYALYNQHRSKLDFVESKLKTVDPGSSSAAGAGDLSSESWYGTIKQKVEESGILPKMTSAWDGLMKFDSIDKMLQAVISEVLTLLKSAALGAIDLAKSLVNTLIELFRSVIADVKASLNAKIEIPILSWLYKNVITNTATTEGDDLTMLDAVCLAIATPSVLLHKLMYDKAPFSEADIASARSHVTGVFPGGTASNRQRSTAANVFRGFNIASVPVATVGMVFNMVSDGLAFASAPARITNMPIKWPVAGATAAPRLQELATGGFNDGKFRYTAVLGWICVGAGAVSQFLSTNWTLMSSTWHLDNDSAFRLYYFLGYGVLAIDAAYVVFYKALEPFKESGAWADLLIGMVMTVLGSVIGGRACFRDNKNFNMADRFYPAIAYASRLFKVAVNMNEAQDQATNAETLGGWAAFWFLLLEGSTLLFSGGAIALTGTSLALTSASSSTS